MEIKEKDRRDGKTILKSDGDGLSQLKTGQDRKRLYGSHLLYLNDLARLWDRLD